SVLRAGHPPMPARHPARVASASARCSHGECAPLPRLPPVFSGSYRLERIPCGGDRVTYHRRPASSTEKPVCPRPQRPAPPVLPAKTFSLDQRNPEKFFPSSLNIQILSDLFLHKVFFWQPGGNLFFTPPLSSARSFLFSTARNQWSAPDRRIPHSRAEPARIPGRNTSLIRPLPRAPHATADRTAPQ